MSCSISEDDSVEASPESAAVLMSECSTAAAPSGAAQGSVEETVTAAGSEATGAATDVSCASAATGSASSVFNVGVSGSGAGVAAVAACPAESSAPGFSLSENILRPPRGPALLPGNMPGDFPVTGQVQGRECGFPPRDRTDAMIPLPRGLCQ